MALVSLSPPAATLESSADSSKTLSVPALEARCARTCAGAGADTDAGAGAGAGAGASKVSPDVVHTPLRHVVVVTEDEEPPVRAAPLALALLEEEELELESPGVERAGADASFDAALHVLSWLKIFWEASVTVVMVQPLSVTLRVQMSLTQEVLEARASTAAVLSSAVATSAMSAP